MTDAILAAEAVLPCGDLDASLAFYVERLGFRVESIFPADAPRVAVIAGHGLRLRLERGAPAGTLALRLRVAQGSGTALVAPEGTRIEFVTAEPALVVPTLRQEFVVSEPAGAAGWHTGRAGMRYRDLVPGRQGGFVIGSQIAIPNGGAVADYVHFHRVRFQAIYCSKGRVRVVYEDQGPPFWLEAGDCVLQPPGIRHRVLEADPGLEVIEFTCPAEHETVADHALTLPTREVHAQREWSGQRFVHHRARDAAWQPWGTEGFEQRDLGLLPASAGAGSARVVRAVRAGDAERTATGFCGLVVLTGLLRVRTERDGTHELRSGVACALPGRFGIAALAGCEFLVVEVPVPS